MLLLTLRIEETVKIKKLATQKPTLTIIDQKGPKLLKKGMVKGNRRGKVSLLENRSGRLHKVLEARESLISLLIVLLGDRV